MDIIIDINKLYDINEDRNIWGHHFYTCKTINGVSKH